MTAREQIKAVCVVLALAFVAVVLVGAWADTKACDARGGVMLKGRLTSYYCYDKASLKRIE